MTRKDRRAALLAAAKELFHSQGFQNTTVQAITAMAGVATGSFYTYFSSKEACFLGLMDLLYQELLAAVVAARQGAPHSLAKLERSLAAAIDVFLRDPALSSTVLGQADSGNPLLRARIEEVKASLIGFLVEDLTEGQAQGVPPNPHLIAHMLFGALAEALNARLGGKLPSEEATSFRANLLRHLVSLIRPGAPSTGRSASDAAVSSSGSGPADCSS
jgi:AcrR family transcriptional regulator